MLLFPEQGQRPSCIHCGNPIPIGMKEFCCQGCRSVHAILTSRGLSSYYALKAASSEIRPARPVSLTPDGAASFSYLDDAGFRKLYCLPDSPAGETRMNFYLEGVHCVACLWLLEKIPQFVEGVTRVRLDLGTAVATVTASADFEFSKVAAEFERLGYTPHPVLGDETEEWARRENRRLLVRVGVAGACTGNIMLLAVSIYGGAAGPLARHFNWLSLLLFLPVFFYSAVPFYRNAWTALRTRSVSIDVPIVLGIWLGAVASFANLFSGSTHVYFDSLSALVFLLLSSRYVLRRSQQSVLRASSLVHFLTPSRVRRKTQDGMSFEEVPMDAIRPGERIQVRAGETIPVDGSVISGVSSLSCALLTGESEPIRIQAGALVYAGTTNLDAPLEIEVKASGYATRLGAILKAIEEGVHRKAPIVLLADRASRYFVGGVLILSAGVFFATLGLGWQEALNRALAMVIVTCPCALALATPLAMTATLGRAARAGMLLKGGDVIERLAQVRTVFLDKTGTLTTGRFSVREWKLLSPDPGVESAVLALERLSPHPIARALVEFLERRPEAPRLSGAFEVTDYREQTGRGISGRFQGHFYEVRRSDEDQLPENSSTGSRVTVSRDGLIVAVAVLGDRLREDSAQALQRLKALGLEVRILSGDSPSAVLEVATVLGIPPEHWTAQATPESKCELLKSHPHSLMVGDGANDALALSSAHVGVAVHGGMEVSLKAADAYLTEGGVLPVHRLVLAGRETLKVIRRNLIFSLLYNIGGAGAVLLGLVNPLFAAILMPASALTVFLSSLAGTRKLRRELAGGAP